MKAISLTEAIEAKKLFIPDFVFESFNELIIKNLKQNGKQYYAKITQEEAISLILSKHDALNRDLIFSYGYLDIESFYTELGWSVEYDKPSIGDNYQAHFIFKGEI